MPPAAPRAHHSIAFVVVICAGLAGATGFATQIDDCSCSGALDRMATKVSANYLGYGPVTRVRSREYDTHLASLRREAAATSPGDCVQVLHRYLRFFRDGHLFAGSSPRLSTEQVTRLRNALERFERTEAELVSYFNAGGRQLDPIEGIWYEKSGARYAIVRDAQPGRRDFAAVVLSSPIEGWMPGHVKAQFRSLSDGTYDVSFVGDDFALRQPYVYLRGESGGAAIRRNSLLHMPPVTWGKTYPLGTRGASALDPSDPRRPTARTIDDRSVLFSIPSHSPEYEPVVSALVEQFTDQLRTADALIVDIRGNEGGASGTTRTLMPFIDSLERKAPRFGPDEGAAMLSSIDNIAYVERVLKEGWLPKDLPARMRANLGNVIAIQLGSASAAPSAPQASGPRRVALLIDGGVISAGEAFTLAAMRSTRVTLFGQPTGGVIDYQNVRLVGGISCPELGFFLGYPTLGRANTSAQTINPTGIVPDVPIDVAINDPMSAILAHYAKQK